MSRSAAFSALARTYGALVCGLALAPAAACHHRPAAGRPAAPDTAYVGYGVQTRAQTGRAVQSLTGDELAKTRVKRVEELLAGRVAGVHVLPTAAGGFSIRIRGASTVVGNSEPLYVVDGMPVQVEPGQGLNWLDPADIARIDVLRDAAETSMYGLRGANGVILITTKRRGSK